MSILRFAPWGWLSPRQGLAAEKWKWQKGLDLGLPILRDISTNSAFIFRNILVQVVSANCLLKERETDESMRRYWVGQQLGLLGPTGAFCIYAAHFLVDFFDPLLIVWSAALWPTCVIHYSDPLRVVWSTIVVIHYYDPLLVMWSTIVIHCWPHFPFSLTAQRLSVPLSLNQVSM